MNFKFREMLTIKLDMVSATPARYIACPWTNSSPTMKQSDV